MKKPIKSIRCKHMPTKENTVVIFSSKHGNKYHAGFTIGNQDFTIRDELNKEESIWYCDMIEIAFNTLLKPPSVGLKNPDSIKQYEDSIKYVTVKNLK